ncbi:hypothetical protein Emed_000461 [Eimeria media]
MGRALAAQRRKSLSLDEEEAFILDTCMQLHEELGYASVPMEPLPDREQAVANIVSSLVQDTLAFASRTSQLTSTGVSFSEPSPHFMPYPPPSGVSTVPALREQPTLQPTSDLASMQWPPEWAHPSVAFPTQSPWSAGDYTTRSTTSSIPSGQPEQVGYYETGFVSFAPSAEEIGLVLQDWDLPGSSLSPRFESGASHQRRDIISVERGEEAHTSQASMEKLSARSERRSRELERRQEEGTGMRQDEELRAGSHLGEESASSLSRAIDLGKSISSWTAHEASSSTQFKPTLFQLLGKRGAFSEDSSEDEEGLEVTPAKKARKSRSRETESETAGLSKSGQPQTRPESSPDHPSTSISRSRGAEASTSVVESQLAGRSSSDTSVSGNTSEESGNAPGSSTSSTWDRDLLLWFPFPPTFSRDDPYHVVFKLKSGVVVRIPHPPEPTPPNTHPFYKIPVVPRSAIDCEFSVERAFFSRDCTTIVGRLLRFQKLLMRSELRKKEVRLLVQLTEEIVRYLFTRHRRPLLADVPSHASQRLGVRLLCFDSVVVSIQLLGHALNPQEWFPRLVDAVPVEYRRPFALEKPKTKRQALLAFQMSRALRQLTRGRRPPMDLLVRLKQDLFNPATAPIMFLKTEWDPWRYADEAYQRQNQ